MFYLLRRLRRPPVITAASYRQRFKVTAILLAAVMLLHIGAMMWLESLSPFEALWLTFTTITTVGYGDLEAVTPPGRIATMALLYAFGIFLLANLAGYWVDFRSERRNQMIQGQWKWNMKDHMVILNAPTAHPDHFLRRLVREIREWDEFADIPIQIVTDVFGDGLPNALRELGVVHHHGDADDPEALEAADIERVSHVLIFARSESDARADTVTLSIVERLHAHDVRAHIVAECVDNRNRDRLLHYYPDMIIVRPVRGYPEMLVRALAAPGTEQILENLFRREGVHPRRYEVAVEGLKWPELVWRAVDAGYGTPLGYLDRDGNIVTTPVGDVPIEASALFMVVDAEHAPSPEALRRLLRG